MAATHYVIFYFQYLESSEYYIQVKYNIIYVFHIY